MLLSGSITRWDILHAAKNLLMTLFGNFAGAVFVGYFWCYLINSDSTEPWVKFVMTLAEKKTSKNVGLLFCSSIACNILVASCIYIVYMAEGLSGKVLAIIFPVSCFFGCSL